MPGSELATVEDGGADALVGLGVVDVDVLDVVGADEQPATARATAASAARLRMITPAAP
jgi:hypothetical protein